MPQDNKKHSRLTGASQKKKLARQKESDTLSNGAARGHGNHATRKPSRFSRRSNPRRRKDDAPVHRPFRRRAKEKPKREDFKRLQAKTRRRKSRARKRANMRDRNPKSAPRAPALYGGLQASPESRLRADARRRGKHKTRERATGLRGPAEEKPADTRISREPARTRLGARSLRRPEGRTSRASRATRHQTGKTSQALSCLRARRRGAGGLRFASLWREAARQAPRGQESGGGGRDSPKRRFS